MARRVFLHIGAPKSGTTYLQTRLRRNAARLAEHDVLVPLGERGDRPAALVFRAALDLTGKRLNHPRSFTDGYWDRLVDQVGAATPPDGTAVVSHEAFVRADEAAVARAVAELGAGPETELHVVYTARDLARQLVSGWVEGLKNGGTHTLDEHLVRAQGGDLPLLTAFDVPALLGRWLQHLPPEQVHVVTVPPPGGDRTLLWRRFLAVCGIDPAWTPEEGARANESVGVPEAQVLLALNHVLGADAQRGGVSQQLVRRTLVGGALVGRDSPRVELPPAHHAWVAEAAAANRRWLQQSGVDVVGDLDELDPRPVDPATWVDPDAPHPDVAAAAAVGLAALIAEAHRRAE